MGNWWYEHEIVCHWCGIHYKAKKGRLQARFHSKACKQAHYRAYNKYVTAIRRRKARLELQTVTLKKTKKKGKSNVKVKS